MPTTRFTKQHTQSRLTTLQGTERRRGERGGLWGRGEERLHPIALPPRQGPRQRFTRPRGARQLGRGDPGSPVEQHRPPGAPGPGSRAGLVLARALSWSPAATAGPAPDAVSRPARSRCSAVGPAREPATRARPSRRQHPGKRRRRRLPGPRPLGPRPGPAGSRLSGRAGPPPIDSPPDRPTGRKEGRKNRPTGTLPPQRPLVTVRSRDSAILLARPPSSSSSEATLPNRRPPPAPPPLAPPRPPAPIHTLAPTAPPHPSGAGPSIAGEEKQAEPGQQTLPNQSEALSPATLPNQSKVWAPASLSPPFSFPPLLNALSPAHRAPLASWATERASSWVERQLSIRSYC